MSTASLPGPSIGLHVPHAFGAQPLSGAEILRRCAVLGVRVIELDASAIEAALGVPVEPAVLRPPELGPEHGLQPLEEAVFQDALRIGRVAFAERLRAWRASVVLDPLAALRDQLVRARVGIAAVHWPGLAELDDDGLAYALRATRAIGADRMSTGCPVEALERLAQAAESHQVVIGVQPAGRAGLAGLEGAPEGSSCIGLTLDLGDWLIGGDGSPCAVLAAHADRVVLVRLVDRRTSDGAFTWFGDGESPIREVLGAMREHAWAFPAIVDIPYDLSSDAEQMGEVARALEYCRVRPRHELNRSG